MCTKLPDLACCLVSCLCSVVLTVPRVAACGFLTCCAITEKRGICRSEEFQREIAILKACRDKNIVTFIGASLQVPLLLKQWPTAMH